MREPGTPVAAGPDEDCLTDMVWAHADRFGDAISFRRRTEDSWQDVTAREFAAQVHAVAAGLIGSGLARGDRVGVAGLTGYPRSVVDFALWTAGCVAVPVPRTVSPPAITRAMSAVGARALVIDTGAAEPDGPPPQSAAACRVWRVTENLIDEDMMVNRVEDEVVHQRRYQVRADDPAVLTIRLGGDGQPVPAAGAELSHRDVLSRARSIVTRYSSLVGPGRSMLVHLPAAHPLTTVMSVSAVRTRTTLGYPHQAGDPIADMATFRPTVVVATPALLEAVRESARHKAQTEDRVRIFDAAEAVAVAYSRAVAGSGAPHSLRLKQLAATRFAYPKLRSALGGRCLAVICAGSPVALEPVHFFRGMGIAVHHEGITADRW